MNKIFLYFFIVTSSLFSGINFSINGDFSNFYALRTSDNSILNIPFKLSNINSTLYFDNFEIHHNYSIEYRKINSDNLISSENMNAEIREFYGTYYFDMGEISFGKQIFTLGSVDENSPIDHFNPYNYYYLLIGGTDKKVPINALSFDLYLETIKISGALSPEHNINYYPRNDPEYSLSLSIYPEKWEFLDNKGSDHESFLSFQFTPNYNSEATLTYLRAFDRVFSLSGFTMHEFTGPYIPELENYLYPDGDGNTQNPGRWFTHRLTEALNIGIVKLYNDFTIRTDFSYFHTFDRYNKNDYSYFRSRQDLYFESLDQNHEDIYTVFNDTMDLNDDGECCEAFIAPFQEDASYGQFTFQFELPLPKNYQINFQYFKYKIINYKINHYSFEGVDINIEDITINVNDIINENGNLFRPGMGSSMSTLTTESLLLSLEKYLLDNNLKITLTSFFDIDKGNGKLVSFESEYNVTENINILFGSTKIYGDKDIQSENQFDPGYTFNLMEDFSHNRIQLQYYF